VCGGALHASADGKSDGYPVVIFGGDHADVPLEETAGSLIADVLATQRISAVLDLSTLSKSGPRRFATDLLERLYHRNRQPLHVVIDEADLLAPQRVLSGGERLLGAMSDLVRRGRVHGLGATLVTQRPATLNSTGPSQSMMSGTTTSLPRRTSRQVRAAHGVAGADSQAPRTTVQARGYGVRRRSGLWGLERCPYRPCFSMPRNI